MGRYVAREVFDCVVTDLRAADMFSLGASVYELCLGRELGLTGVAEVQEWHNIRDGVLDDSFCAERSTALVQTVKEVHTSCHNNPARARALS